MTIDKQKLKAAALAIREGTILQGSEAHDAMVEFEGLATPDAVLSLLEEIEEDATHMRAFGEVMRSQAEQIDQIKAENEALRKDAERYRWLRQKQLPLDGHDFLSTQEILDRRIDAAMAEESIHD